MCYCNRLTRVARWPADYPEWLQFCWDFVKPPRNDEIALQHFFSCLQHCKKSFFYFICAACNFFFQQALAGISFQNHPPPLRSNTFVDYCYVITRHIQDGALQVTKEATSKCSCHILTGNWRERQLCWNSWRNVFVILEKLFLDITFPLREKT